MARENNIFTVPGLMANADLSTKQFHCVKMTAVDNKVGLCSADGEVFLGVLQNKPNADGVAAEVRALGISKVVADEALTAGDHWGVSSDGQAKKVEVTNTGADLEDFVMGVVIEGAPAGALATVTVGFPTFQVSAS